MTSIERMRETERGELHFKEPLKLAALGRLTGVVAHEFNKLLAVVIGNLDQIRTRSRDGEARQRASAAVVAAAHGARLIQSLLDFASSEPRDHRVSDLNTVIAEMKPLLCQILGPRIGLEFGLARAACPVAINPIMMEMAILNLVVDARHAMAEPGAIRIETANVTLSDEVDGMRGPFVAVTVSATPQEMPSAGHGTAPGLTMVNRFAKRSHGRVDVCDHAGRRAAVTVYLPRSRSVIGVSRKTELAV